MISEELAGVADGLVEREDGVRRAYWGRAERHCLQEPEIAG